VTDDEPTDSGEPLTPDEQQIAEALADWLVSSVVADSEKKPDEPE
jgi:hypothetical protein